MKKYLINRVAFLILFSVVFFETHAQINGEVQITGEILKPYKITLDDLKKMPRTEVSRKDRDSNEHKYSGVLLSYLLTEGGATTGKNLRGNNLKKYVIVEALDGYQVVFSLAELDAEFSENKIILADTIDNLPLAAADGPFRIIVEHDKRPARCIKQVIGIEVGVAK